MDDLDGRHLVIVANRLPVSRDGSGWRASSGGLVTALRPVVTDVSGHWIGWDGGEPDVPARVEGFDAELHPIKLSTDEVHEFYEGFSNRTLWPLYHDLLQEPVIDRSWWRSYEDVNHRFARAAASLDVPNPVFWVQDYHLQLVPGMLRALRPDAQIGFFLHIPFPPPELVARLPWRNALLDGLLGANALGFHTEWYRANFVRTVKHIHRDVTVSGDTIYLPDGHAVRTRAHPISIDAADFAALATAEETKTELEQLRDQFAGRHVFLGVDRLDYTKGIRHRLQAIQRLLSDRPDLRSRFAFVQVAVPSREDVEEYRDLRDQVEQVVGNINGRFTEPGHDVPVHYLHRSVPRERLAAYYRLADVMCITPLKDGMNLVAKEFVTVQDAGGESGVLLLSEFTGASQEFAEDALLCNPFDVESLAGLMARALDFDPADRRHRIERMAGRVRSHDVFDWVRDELATIVRDRRAP